MRKQKGITLSLSKGFTIIELIVVIAIIAVLAAIVLINLVSYINKGRDASARADLSSALTSSALYYSDASKGNGTYNGFTDDPSYQSIYDALIGAGFGSADIFSFCDVTDCTDPSTNWCMSVKLKAPSVANASFCVDSTGVKKETGLSICDSDGLCN